MFKHGFCLWRTVLIMIWSVLPLIKQYDDHNDDNADKTSDYSDHH